MEPRLLEVGHVAKAHGLGGEVVVHLVTNRLERVAAGSRLLAAPPTPSVRGATARGDGPGAAARPERELVVMSSKPHGTRHIVSFAGVDSREAADSLHGHVLYAEGLDSEGELYVHELIGSEVEDSTGRRLGRVSAVEANPASDLLVIEGKWYVPVRFVVEQGEGRIVVEIPDGLIE